MTGGAAPAPASGTGAATHLDLRALPKAELHLHFEAAMSRASARELADRYGHPEPPTGQFTDQREFVAAYERARDLIGSLEDLRELGRRLGRNQRAEGAVWTEVHFAPATYAGRLGPADGLLEAVLDGLRSGAGGDHAGLILVVNRGRSIADAEATLDTALRWVDHGVVALGLAGDEASHPAGKFSDTFARARAAGLTVVPHAGEGAGPAHVRETLDVLAPYRICHGVRAIEDDAVVELLRERDVCLDIAPLSNVLLRLAPDLPSHPGRHLLRRGVAVTLNTDIPLFSGAGLVEEYHRCSDAWGLTTADVRALAATSLQRALCPSHVRSEALSRLLVIDNPGRPGQPASS